MDNGESVRTVVYETDLYLHDEDLAAWIEQGITLRMGWLEALDDVADVDGLRDRLVGAVEVATVIAARLRTRPKATGPAVERSSYHNLLGEVVDALHDELRSEVGGNQHVLNKVEESCAELGSNYLPYIGSWF